MKDDNIILFSVIKKDSIEKNCSHTKVVVDEDLNTLTCKECNQELNPIMYIANIARKEGNADYRLNVLRKTIADLSKTLEAQNSCKCSHCGFMTKINKKYKRSVK